jgi:hypothetical protein
MVMYSFVPHFREVKFCGVFDKLGCAADEKRLQNTALEHTVHICTTRFNIY